MNNPWLNVLDQRFLDGHLTNCRHAGGAFALSAPPPQVAREPSADAVITYYARLDGHWLRFTPTTPLRDVVGTELRVRMRLRNPVRGQSPRTFCAGDGWTLGLREGQLTLAMDGGQWAWAGFPNVAGSWFDIGWSWRVSGQSVLSFDGAAVAAWPNVRAGRPYDFTRFRLGSEVPYYLPFPPPPSPPNPENALYFYADVAHVRLDLLTRERSEKSLDAAFPLRTGEPSETAACWEQFAPTLRALTALFRDLISAAVAGAAGSLAGARLHAQAVEAATLLARYADGQDDALKEFQSALEQFLTQLKKLAGGRLPDVERQVNQILSGVEVSADCRKTAEELFARQGADTRLQLLLDTVGRTIRQTLEVDWHG